MRQLQKQKATVRRMHLSKAVAKRENDSKEKAPYAAAEGTSDSKETSPKAAEHGSSGSSEAGSTTSSAQCLLTRDSSVPCASGDSSQAGRSLHRFGRLQPVAPDKQALQRLKSHKTDFKKTNKKEPKQRHKKDTKTHTQKKKNQKQKTKQNK